jgi:hypothetical protein
VTNEFAGVLVWEVFGRVEDWVKKQSMETWNAMKAVKSFGIEVVGIVAPQITLCRLLKKTMEQKKDTDIGHGKYVFRYLLLGGSRLGS